MARAAKIDPATGQAAIRAWAAGTASPTQLATAVRFSLAQLVADAPGRAVEVRVPPYGAIQCVAGPTHTRGTPPATVETDPQTWLRLISGASTWAEALATGSLTASGARSDLSPHLDTLHRWFERIVACGVSSEGE